MDGIKLPLQGQQNIFQVLSRISAESLNTGDILRGRVLSLENSILLLKLLDGSSFTCKVPENFSVRQNELVTLEIGEQIDDQLTAKIISISDSLEGYDTKELSKSSAVYHEITDADSSLINDITRQLMSYNIKPTQKLVMDVLNILKDNSGLTTQKGTFISVNDLNSDSDMLKIFEKISQHELQLNDNLQTLKNELLDVLSAMSGHSKSEILKPLIISRQLDELSILLGRELALLPDSLKDSIVSNICETLTKILLNEMQEDNKSITAQKTDIIENLIKNTLDSIEHSDITKIVDEQSRRNKDAINHKTQDNILKLINKTLEKIHTQTQKVEYRDLKEVESILNRFFDKAVLKIEKGVCEDTNIKEKMRALESIIKFSENVLTRTGNLNSLPEFREIDQAYRFFSQVSTYNLAMHLPLKINNENTTGELYIMKRKGRKKQADANNFTLLISLSTKALGLIESFINSTNKCVTISFRVEKEELVQLVKENYRTLYDKLMDKGYKLADMKCRMLEKPRTSIVDAEVKAETNLGLNSKVDLII